MTVPPWGKPLMRQLTGRPLSDRQDGLSWELVGQQEPEPGVNGAGRQEPEPSIVGEGWQETELGVGGVGRQEPELGVDGEGRLELKPVIVRPGW